MHFILKVFAALLGATEPEISFILPLDPWNLFPRPQYSTGELVHISFCCSYTNCILHTKFHLPCPSFQQCLSSNGKVNTDCPVVMLFCILVAQLV